MIKETRFLSRELRMKRSDSGAPQLSGYAAVFNSTSEDLGGFREIIMPGAFTATLANSADVRALFNHEESLILGRTKAQTLELSEDNVGLAFMCTLPDTSVGRDLAVSIERGDVDQCSFGFTCLDDSWEMRDGIPTRFVKTADLFDVSVVTYPAYQATSVSMRSSTQNENIAKAIKTLRNFDVRNCDNDGVLATHDEYCNCVEICAPSLRLRILAASL